MGLTQYRLVAPICRLSGRITLVVAIIAFLNVVAPAEEAVEPGHAGGSGELSERARRLHAESLLIDGHNDLAWAVRKNAGGSWKQADIAQPQRRFHTDIPRLRAGNVGAQFWSVYVPADTRFRGQSAQQTFEQIELVSQMIRKYPETFAKADSAEDIRRIHADGKIACLLGVEGGHSIENSLTLLRQFRELGVKYMTLTHGDTIEWADSSTDVARHGGLTEFGEQVVREMNRLGMIVDISHVADETVEDAIRVSRAPVIASHSSARAVADHPRNLSDALLKQIAEDDGVIMVNFYSGFVVPESAAVMTEWTEVRRAYRQKYTDPAEYQKAATAWWRANPMQRGTIEDVVKHIDHTVKVAGIDHVGLGADFDGVDTLPVGLDDVSTYPRITQALIDLGYPDEDIRKILGENLMRVLAEVDAVAEQLREEQPTP